MTRVKLYAFANTRPSYTMCFAPERPLIVLKTQKSNNNNNSKKNEQSQNDCNQCENDHDITNCDEHSNNEIALTQEAENACSQ